MYPTIYDAVKDLFGISIPFLKLLQSFGFFVAISFLISAWVFAKELARKEKLGLLKATIRKVTTGIAATSSEIASQILFGFLIGWKFISIPFLSAVFNEDPRAYMLSFEGNIYIGIAAGCAFGFWKWKSTQKNKLAESKEIEETVGAAEHIGNMTMVAALFGFLGAKIFHMLENFSDFLEAPGEMFFSFSGLTMYGGLILGGIAVLVYAKKQGFNIFHVMDACAPGLFLAYGIGRLGCQISGDGDWGIVNLAPKPGWLNFLPDWIWAYDYPNNVNQTCNPYTNPNSIEYIQAQLMCDPENIRLAAPVFPTPLYESFVNIIFFFILWSQRKKFSSPGALFCVYLIFNGLERFLVELIRVNTTLFKIGMYHVTQAEIIALGLMTLGGLGLVWTKKRAIKTQ